jgi:hypothetical protein
VQSSKAPPTDDGSLVIRHNVTFAGIGWMPRMVDAIKALNAAALALPANSN